MRLTLRTLLAYLDGILEPNDAQDIAKKIEESEFATGLVQRIRDVMRRMRLGAPSLTDRVAKLDSNTVAEYLDNTLTSEAVTDFEKVCLDSDIHLAEVAACHQILTLVLGEPAEIDPASRERMYQIRDVPTGGGPPAIPVGGGSGTAEALPTIDFAGDDGRAIKRRGRRRPTVPEYLREPQRRRWIPLAVVASVACLIVALLWAVGHFRPNTLLGRTLAQWGLITAAQPAGAGQRQSEKPGATEEKERSATKEPVKGVATSKSAAEPTKEPAAANVPAGQRGKVTIAEPIPAPTAETEKKELEKKTTEPLVKAGVGPTTELKIRPDTTVEGGTIVESKAGAVLPHSESIKEGEKQATGETVAGLPLKPADESNAATEAARTAPQPPPLPPEPLGRLVSNDQVLLQQDPAIGGWVRVAVNQLLSPQRLLALPTYRPKVATTAGVMLEIVGGTEIEILPSKPDEGLGIHVPYGRVMMTPLDKPGVRLRVAFGNRSGVLTFTDPVSVAAFDVRRVHAPGTDPEGQPPHIVAKLYATTGALRWEENGGREGRKSFDLVPPQWVSFNGPLTSMPAESTDLPSWITSDSPSPSDRRASPAIAQLTALPTDRLARLELMQLATSRPQKEVKWLAFRCLASMGHYRDLVAALNDRERRLDWPEYLDVLCESVARDKESAAAVRKAIEQQYPQQAAELYRMLWGYSDKDLKGGEDVKLVKGLRDETSLAVRVLSWWNLWKLTGMGGWSYRPEQPAARRQQPTVRWEQRLKAGEIRLKTPEEKAAAEETPPAAPETNQ